MTGKDAAFQYERSAQCRLTRREQPRITFILNDAASCDVVLNLHEARLRAPLQHRAHRFELLGFPVGCAPSTCDPSAYESLDLFAECVEVDLWRGSRDHHEIDVAHTKPPQRCSRLLCE